MAGTLNRTCAWLAACIVALASWKGRAQTAVETQRDFAAGLVRFIDAIAGTYGDDGPHIASALETMNAGLARWNATLETAERATASRAQSRRRISLNRPMHNRRSRRCVSFNGKSSKNEMDVASRLSFKSLCSMPLPTP